MIFYTNDLRKHKNSVETFREHVYRISDNFKLMSKILNECYSSIYHEENSDHPNLRAGL